MSTTLSERIDAMLAILTGMEQQLAEQRLEIEAMRYEAALRHKRDRLRALIREVMRR